jgi:ubiquitin-protein ligase
MSDPEAADSRPPENLPPNLLCLSRLQIDFNEMTPEAFPGITLRVPDKSNLQHFIIRIRPFIGLWATGQFDFQCVVPDDFPFSRPHMKCLTRIWHPNIEETGAVCLNVLREKYRCIMSIGHLALAVQALLHDPNPDDPLNKEAGEQFLDDFEAFKTTALQYIAQYCPRDEEGS